MTTVWSQEIDAILSTGRSLSPLGSNNWVLTKAAALSAVREIQSLGVPILGGDAYSVSDSDFIFDYAGWYSDPREGEARATFVDRSAREAEAYICAYPNEEALFSIVPDKPR